MSKREKTDRACVREFASFLKTIGRPVDGVDRWPEDGGAQKEIDGIVGPYAIQHTSVDALPRGREADDWFKKIVGDLEGEFAGRLGFPLAIAWEWAAVQKGQKWPKIGDALRKWITNDAPNLTPGHHRITSAPGVPFDFEVSKDGPIKFDGVKFARIDPKDTTFSMRLRDQIAGADHDKLTVLGRYQAEGMKGLLLLQSSDIALMNPVKLAQALQAAFPTRPAEVDEVWFMHYAAPGMVNAHDLRSGAMWLYDLSSATVSHHNPHGPQLRWAT